MVSASDGYKTIEYDKVIAVLVEAIREQQAMIDTANERILELQKKIGLIGKKWETLQNVSMTTKPGFLSSNRRRRSEVVIAVRQHERGK